VWSAFAKGRALAPKTVERLPKTSVGAFADVADGLSAISDAAGAPLAVRQRSKTVAAENRCAFAVPDLPKTVVAIAVDKIHDGHYCESCHHLCPNLPALDSILNPVRTWISLSLRIFCM
jgi:hypothetical protein